MTRSIPERERWGDQEGVLQIRPAAQVSRAAHILTTSATP